MATFHLEKDPLFCSSSIPLRPQYIAATAEQILDRGGENQFDVVCGLEIIEHVRNPKEFVATCVKLVKVQESFCFLLVLICERLMF
jgi:2-polyprenyl-3-methyl-5-hydroxy-6-metoxy-1,4-benzoquinol methylase